MLFFANKVVSEGLTFNNALLMAYYSAVLPCNFEHSSWFNRYISVNLSVVMVAANAHEAPSIFNIPM